MGEEIDRFDADYEIVKNEIKDNLNFLENEWDMLAILSWITRLEEPASCPEAKARRNEYAKYLAYQLSRQTLHFPFTEDPPSGSLPPLGVSMTKPTCPDSHCGAGKEHVKSPAKVICEMKPQNYTSPSTDVSSSKSGFSQWPLRSPATFIHHSPCQSSKTKPRSESGPKEPCMPCDPCAQATKSLVREKKPCRAPPFKCSLEHQSCSPPIPPRSLPHGYLSKTAEEDDGMFTDSPSCSQENMSRLSKIVEAVDEETELFEYMNEVAPYTCDLGETMHLVSSDELAHFKEFVRSVYRSRMADTQEILTKEHIKLKSRYDEWESNVLRQAQAALRALKLILPQFKYDSYKKDPEYLYYMLKNQMTLDQTGYSPQARILRAKAQKKTWINEEAQRIEKDNMDRTIQMRELNAQLAALSKLYNASHKKLTERNKCLEDDAAQLRIRHDENQKLIDLLIDQLNTFPREY